jgi:hypothetical protein
MPIYRTSAICCSGRWFQPLIIFYHILKPDGASRDVLSGGYPKSTNLHYQLSYSDSVIKNGDCRRPSPSCTFTEEPAYTWATWLLSMLHKCVACQALETLLMRIWLQILRLQSTRCLISKPTCCKVPAYGGTPDLQCRQYDSVAVPAGYMLA